MYFFIIFQKIIHIDQPKTPAQEEARFKVMQFREANSVLTKRKPARELDLSTKGIITL